MKRGQATGWLYFCTLYCTGSKLASIGWIYRACPISSVSMSGEASLEREGLGNTAVLGTCSGLSTNIWVGEPEGKTNVS